MATMSRIGYLWHRFRADSQQKKAVSSMPSLQVDSRPLKEIGRDGQYVFWAKRPILFMEKPVSFGFFTGRQMILAGNTGHFDIPPINPARARVAEKICRALPALLLLLEEKIRSYDPQTLLSVEEMKAKLEDPCVIIDEEHESPESKAWSFQVLHTEYAHVIIAGFLDLNFQDISMAG